MGKISVVLALVVTLVALTLGSCNSAGCIDNQSSIPLVGFYSSSTQQGISVDSISIGGVGAIRDSMIIENGQNVSRVYLPFRSAYDNVSFYIRYEQKALRHDALNDTITFDYESIPYFVSEECGAMYYYQVKHIAYTRHVIDSVAMPDTLVTNTDVERIRIYFRTAETEE